MASSAVKVQSLVLGFMQGSDNTLYVRFAKPNTSMSNIENFKVVWRYTDGHKIKKKDKKGKITYKYVWFTGSEVTIDKDDYASNRYTSTYSIPDNAVKIKVSVRPISVKKSNDSNKDKIATSWESKDIKPNNPNLPDLPSAPTLVMLSNTKGEQKLVVTLSGITDPDFKYARTRFKYTRPDGKTYYRYEPYTAIKKVSGAAGNNFYLKVPSSERGRTVTASLRASVNKSGTKARDDYSPESNEVGTLPFEIRFNKGSNTASAAKEKYCRVLSPTSVRLQYILVRDDDGDPDSRMAADTTFDVEYTTNATYFDSNPDMVSSKSVDGHATKHMEITDLTSGSSYVFRCRATNSGGSTAWTPEEDRITFKIGTKPSAPTTWSNLTTITSDTDAILYWTHNSSDESLQQKAEINFTINNTEKTIIFQNGKGVSEPQLGVSTSYYTWIYFSSASVTGTTIPSGSTITDAPTSDTQSIGIAVAKGSATKSKTTTDYKWYSYTSFSQLPLTITDSTTGRSYAIRYAGDYNSNDISNYREEREYLSIIVTKNNTSGTYTILMPSSANNYSYTIPSSVLLADSTITWKVRTQGIMDTEDYWSDWSTEREIKVYTQPSLNMVVKDESGQVDSIVTSLPITVTTNCAPITQKPLTYYLEIISNDDYITTDVYGNDAKVSSGDVIFSDYYIADGDLEKTIGYESLTFNNTSSYTLTLTASMDSGLIAEDSITFDAEIVDDETIYVLASVGPNEEDLTMEIQPYCVDENETLATGYSLSVYRVSYNGEMIEIATGIDNEGTLAVIDPHPQLNDAVYRVVATNINTGKHTAMDTEPMSLGVDSIVIQWGSNDIYPYYEDEDDLVESGDRVSDNFVILPYNIDISETNKIDVETVNYIGRRDPVAYYGTNIDTGGSWTSDIDATDTITLTMLRLLSNYLGNVYVREPSGVGYWATVNVTWSKKHEDLVIPVTITVVRVEGESEAGNITGASYILDDEEEE